ncbi:hypothetical protein Hs30E_10950 [Lactococcus hodotermopsidis]|uniref:Gylcosyl hydrolase 115 C-terminal domain-containing protein n=1 Tax=Pseudolactococcus hodotermopsidis TaxID=2709157 RepID=A0A6A0BDJ0_9LACT|nr:glycosyl hydrolase 115 family protein [Lactococcus hodotermopsidis]GFH42544.1 hypothetical protein Hs30E_10950 [Lactococcus hodotermopsidis]
MLQKFEFASSNLIYAPNESKAVSHAAENVAADMTAVTKTQVLAKASTDLTKSHVIIVASLTNAQAIIAELQATGKITADDLAKIDGQWESYIIKQVDNQLIIVGSDRRGAVYGLYRLSDEMGVSPWTFFGDAPMPKNPTASISVPETIFQKSPSVKYRGIFLNDEAPALTSFCEKNFGPEAFADGALQNPTANKGFNHHFYTHIFDVILRLKGNYLWPAMWGNAFWTDDPKNSELADEYGIVMGTTHQEFMVSSDMEFHWWAEQKGYTEPDGAPLKWDFYTNGEKMTEFWSENVNARSQNENVYTLGIRGLGDSLAAPVGTTEADNIKLVSDVFQSQRKILENAGLNVSQTPQVLALYKEVENYYYHGLNKEIPAEVTILLSDDNHGNLRTLPTKAMRDFQTGGFGMYYHFDYHGGPRDFRWVNTSPIEKTREQMLMAYNYGVQDLWIVNVGDLMPLQYPIEHWFKLGYDIDHYGTIEGTADFAKEFTAREFTDYFAADDLQKITHVLAEYPRLNAVRKPEWLGFDDFNVLDGEAQTYLESWQQLDTLVTQLLDHCPSEVHDSFYQFVYYPVHACANVAKIMINLGYQKNGIDPENSEKRARKALAEDTAINDYLNYGLHDGKYYGYGMEFHLGQTTWHSPLEQFEFKPSNMLDFSFADKPMGQKVEIKKQTAAVLADINTDLPDKTAIENDGVISILATDFAATKPAKNGATWTILPNYGREKSALKVQPDQVDVHPTTIDVRDNAYVDFNIYVKTAGTATIVTQFAPSTSPVNSDLTHLRYAIQLVEATNETPLDDVQVVNILSDDFMIMNGSGYTWSDGVDTAVHTATIRNGNICLSHHEIPTSGTYKIRIYMVDDGLVLQKVQLATFGQPTITAEDGGEVPLVLVGPTDWSGDNSIVDVMFQAGTHGAKEEYDVPKLAKGGTIQNYLGAKPSYLYRK